MHTDRLHALKETHPFSPNTPPRGTPGRRRLDSSQHLSNAKWYEQWLRNNIIAHPRITLGLALTSGLLLGWWVKR